MLPDPLVGLCVSAGAGGVYVDRYAGGSRGVEPRFWARTTGGCLTPEGGGRLVAGPAVRSAGDLRWRRGRRCRGDFHRRVPGRVAAVRAVGGGDVAVYRHGTGWPWCMPVQSTLVSRRCGSAVLRRSCCSR